MKHQYLLVMCAVQIQNGHKQRLQCNDVSNTSWQELVIILQAIDGRIANVLSSQNSFAICI